MRCFSHSPTMMRSNIITASKQTGESRAKHANGSPICTVPYRTPDDAEHLFDGLRKAGLPEA